MKDVCFSSLILTEKVDYRYDQISLKIKYELPKEIAEECINLTKQFGLKTAGIDLIKLDNNFYLLTLRKDIIFTQIYQFIHRGYISSN